MILLHKCCRMATLTCVVAVMYMCTDERKNTDEGGEILESDFVIAMLQLKSYGADLEENLEIGDKYCRKAQELGADIALFPEMWSIGYSRYHWPDTKFTQDKYPISFEEWRSRAVNLESRFISHYRDLAKELQMGIVITYLQEWDPLPRNSSTVIGPNGEILMTYAKVHTSDMIATESNCTPGDEFFVCDYPLEGGNTVKLGMITCFDREHPESARIVMLKGAEIMLTPNACNLDDRRINQFQSRAFENAMGVVMTNYAAPSQNGRSCAFDAEGYKILVADDNEDVYLAAFDLAKLRKHRKRTIWGNAYRRPQKYGELLSLEVDSVFVRKNGLGEPFLRRER